MSKNQTIDHWLNRMIKEQKIDQEIASKSFQHKKRVQNAKWQYYKSGFQPQRFLELKK